MRLPGETDPKGAVWGGVAKLFAGKYLRVLLGARDRCRVAVVELDGTGASDWGVEKRRSVTDS